MDGQFWNGPTLGYHGGDPLPGDTELTPEEWAARPAPAGGTMAQAAQLEAAAEAYTQAIAKPVAFTPAGGVMRTFQTDPASIQNMANMLLAFAPPATAPPGFYWVAADNTQVPFTYQDLQGLAQAVGAQGFQAFRSYQTAKAAIAAQGA